MAKPIEELALARDGMLDDQLTQRRKPAPCSFDVQNSLFLVLLESNVLIFAVWGFKCHSKYNPWLKPFG